MALCECPPLHERLLPLCVKIESIEQGWTSSPCWKIQSQLRSVLQDISDTLSGQSHLSNWTSAPIQRLRQLLAQDTHPLRPSNLTFEALLATKTLKCGLLLSFLKAKYNDFCDAEGVLPLLWDVDKISEIQEQDLLTHNTFLHFAVHKRTHRRSSSCPCRTKWQAAKEANRTEERRSAAAPCLDQCRQRAADAPCQGSPYEVAVLSTEVAASRQRQREEASACLRGSRASCCLLKRPSVDESQDGSQQTTVSSERPPITPRDLVILESISPSESPGKNNHIPSRFSTYRPYYLLDNAEVEPEMLPTITGPSFRRNRRRKLLPQPLMPGPVLPNPPQSPAKEGSQSQFTPTSPPKTGSQPQSADLTAAASPTSPLKTGSQLQSTGPTIVPCPTSPPKSSHRRSFGVLGSGGGGDRWWVELTDVCPISNFPVSLLPYPPFRLYARFLARSTAEVEVPDLYLDGLTCILKVIKTMDFSILGHELTPGLVEALDRHVKKCKLGAFRLQTALSLKERAQSSREAQLELEQLRLSASQRLSHLRALQRRRKAREGHNLHGQSAEAGCSPGAYKESL